MRFDDILRTVLATDLSAPRAAEAVWRQLVDLIARRGDPADADAMATLTVIRDDVPAQVRAASARAIQFTRPPVALVRLFVRDRDAIAAPLLRSARLDAGDWIALLPELTPWGRSVLRHRRDLPPEVVRALASFGAIDFVLPDATEWPVDAAPPEAEVPPATRSAPAKPRVEQHRQAVSGEPEREPYGPFRVADVMARINAYRERREVRDAGVERPLAPAPPAECFRFETDARGELRRVDGANRAALVGLSIARGTALAQVDGVAAGAFRRRGAFRDGRLVVEGACEEVRGLWLIAGVPAFDPATGRFTGYRGVARRPRADECAERAHRERARQAEALRTLLHELRTPANAISGFAQMIEGQMLGPVPTVYRERAWTIGEQASDLLNAIDDLDLAARIEGDALDLRPGEVALRPLLATIAGDLRPLAEVRGAELALPANDAAVRCDPDSVERLLGRLLATLLGAAASGERIEVRLDARDAAVIVSIDLPEAFERRHREAHADEPGGMPLGAGFALRLAHRLAVKLGGAMTVGASSLTLRLPGADTGPVEQAHQS